MISLGRVVKGFLASAIAGVFLGSVMGMSSKMQNLVLPAITVIRQIPMVAWIPLIILWAGIGENSKVIIIMIAAVFPILVNTLRWRETTADSTIGLNYLCPAYEIFFAHTKERINVLG